MKFWVALFAMLLLGAVGILRAATVRSPSVVPDGGRYYRQSTTSTTGTAVAFPGGSATASVRVANEDTGNLLYIKFIRAGDPVTSAELTAPVNATWGEVFPISSDLPLTFDVRGSPGFIWDRAAGTGAFNIHLID